MATTRIYRTPASASAGTIWTVSMWIKGGATSANQILFSADTGGSFTFRTYVQLSSSGVLNFGGVDNGNTNGSLATTRVFRDPTAWYHLVFVWDNANATSADKMIIYVNGVRETEVTYTAPTTNSRWNMNNRTEIGSRHGGDRFFSGEMSHVHNCDGYAYAASDFGETDATDGMWKIKTAPSVSYGTNGFFLKMEDSSNLDLDSSSNGHTFTTAGTLTATQDNPDNNFCTWNPLVNQASGFVLSNGNTTADNTNDTWRSVYSTLAPSAGKYYFECKIVNQLQTPRSIIGVCSTAQASNASARLGHEGTNAYAYGSDGNKINNGTHTSYGNTFATGNIISCALDLDNGKIYFGKNGTWENSGDPTSGGTGTGSAFDVTLGEFYYFGSSSYGNEGIISINSGNGYFGTTAITSAGTNASGNGDFEYDVPTGYTALSTKGLNT